MKWLIENRVNYFNNGIPVIQQIKSRVLYTKTEVIGRSKYPLVLMLEPLLDVTLHVLGVVK